MSDSTPDTAPEDQEPDTAPEDGEREPDTAPEDGEREPDTEELEEPSAAKDPGEEPKAPGGGEDPADDGKSHHAVGIGVVESEVPVDPGENPDEDPYEA